MKTVQNKILCLCGSIINKYELSRHKTTKKHIKYLSKGYHFINQNYNLMENKLI